jgi:hypothetical protein
MKIRDLTRQTTRKLVPAWPLIWAGSVPFADPVPDPGDGILESVRILESTTTLLRLTMRLDAREHAGILRWDAPPSLETVESLLSAHLGREIRAIGELDV